ncbi:MAG TPA: carboxypeptidase-like regulatory domain-containing protein, partial [Vicinamibacterales bacterium]
MRTRIWASIVVVAFVVPLLAAQVDFGAINGVVTDSSGAVLPGVTIELTGPEKRTVLTGDRGEFSVVRLRPGEYDVLITLAGFSTVRTKVVLTAGRTERLTIQMRVAAVEETVTVIGETPRVNMQPAAAQFGTVVGGVIGGGVVGAPLAGAREGFNTESYDHI